jgi:hypothetical protein
MGSWEIGAPKPVIPVLLFGFVSDFVVAIGSPLVYESSLSLIGDLLGVLPACLSFMWHVSSEMKC